MSDQKPTGLLDHLWFILCAYGVAVLLGLGVGGALVYGIYRLVGWVL